MHFTLVWLVTDNMLLPWSTDAHARLDRGRGDGAAVVRRLPAGLYGQGIIPDQWINGHALVLRSAANASSIVQCRGCGCATSTCRSVWAGRPSLLLLVARREVALRALLLPAACIVDADYRRS